MPNNQPITILQDEYAGLQRAIESAKDRIALLVRERDEARAQVEALEIGQRAWTEIGTKAQADAAALRAVVLAYVVSATSTDRDRMRSDMYLMATTPGCGAALLAELEAVRKVVAQVRWAVDNHYAPPPLYDALAAHDAAVKGREG